MRKGLLTSLLALAFTGLYAQQLPQTPKLVVTLTIDQLRTDYMEAFSSLYGEDGFKRLMREGRVYRQAEYPFATIDRASAVAALHTGATPSVNGIIAENWLDAKTLRPVNCADDPDFMGNYTNESSSPRSLLTSTLGDELRIATTGKGLVYAIAPYRDAALFSAGHAANGAFWLNEETGKWCSTTYYGEFPWWLSQYNDRHSPDHRIKELIWTPALPPHSYNLVSGWRTEGFKYRFETERQNKYRRFLTSPLINDEVNRLAEDLLTRSTIGMDVVPDLLSLTYYAGIYNHRPIAECAMELQDAYVRLDRSIATLLKLIDSKIGLQNTLLCIVSTGYIDNEPADAGTYRIPGGEFHLNRCATLLNMYLMATYGESHYVEGYYNNQIYLNHKLIETKQLNLMEIQEKAADFLVQFSGVKEVYSAHRLLLGLWSPLIERQRNSYHRQRSGDLTIEILPGWTLVKEQSDDHHVVRTAHTSTPLILLGAGIEATIINTPINTNCVAPTLAGAMRIRAPNGSTEAAIELR